MANFFHTLGNAVTKSHAFGDPLETFRRNTPAGLLDDFTEDEQREIGERLQSQFRTPGSRRSVRDRHLSDVESLYADRVAKQQREQLMGALPNLVQGGELTEHQAKVIASMPTEDGYAAMSEILKPANVAAGTQRFVGSNAIAYTPTISAQDAPREKREAEAERARLDARLDAWADNADLTEQQRRAFKELPVEQKQKLATDRTSVGGGSGLYDAHGNRLAGNPTSDIQEYEYGLDNPEYAKDKDAAAGGPTADMRNRDDRIKTRMEVYGIDEQWATKLELGDAKIQQDPGTGRNFAIDLATKSQTPIDAGPDRILEIEGTPSVKEGVDVEATTGVTGSLRRMLNTAADAAGMGTPYDLTSQARTELNNFNQVFKLRFADYATEGRRSNMIIEMLDSLTANPAHFLQGSEDARRKLEAIDRLLDQTVTDQTGHILSDPYSFKPADVRKAEQTARGLNGLRQDVKILLEGMGKAGEISVDPELDKRLEKYR